MRQTFKNADIDDQWLPQNYAEFIINKIDWGKTPQTTKKVSWLNLVKNQIQNWNTNNNSFLQKYANTAPSNNQIYMVDGYQVQR
jgi:hypothetical protein